MTEPSVAGDPAAVVEDACHEPFRTALDAIEARAQAGILRVLENGRAVHAELVESTGLATAPPDPWEERAERLLDFRRRLSGEVLAPIRAHFDGSRPGPSMATDLEEALRDARERARALPASVESTWPAGALDAKPSDSFSRRWRKLAARLASAARKAGDERSLPARATALHHLDTTLAETVDAAGVDALRSWARWERDMEAAWIEWGDTALPALVEAELPDEPGDDDAEGSHAPWAAVRESAQALDARLAELVESCPLQEILARLRSELERARESLMSDLAVAGSFVFDPRDTHRLEPSLSELQRTRPALERWADGVSNRLRLYEELLAILAGATAVQRRLVYRVREEHLAGTAVLADVASELEGLADELERGPELPLPRRLERLEADVRRILEPTGQAVPSSTAVDETVQVRGNATVEALLAMIRQAPARVELHAEDGRLPRADRTVETRSLALQDLARQAFDALRIERIRSSTAGLVGSIDEVRADVEELPNVFAFAFDAARKELDEGEEGAEERAAELVTEALRSMAESLHNARRSLDAAVLRAQARLAKEVSEGSLGLLDRLAAGRMQARLLAARSSVAELRAWMADRWGPSFESARRSATARWKLLSRLASRGLRKGTEIVGTGPGTGAASVRTLRTLSDSDALLRELPLVYQRLFTLEPLDDPSLLAARSNDLADGMDRWSRWRAQDGVPLVVRGRPGSGITSFLNVLGSRISDENADFGRVALDERVDGEAALAGLLSSVLGVDAAASLDGLAGAVFDASNGSLPDAVTVDNLEHLYLRIPDGTDLFERLLTLMAETEPRIFWIGGVTSSAWQLIATAEPTAVSQVDVLALEQLSAAGLREALTLRHRRSGLPLRYEEPDGSRRMLRRRLRRLRDREAYDDLVAEAYFDRLEKTSSRHLRLALFQWLHSADFGQADGVVMHPPERPDFTVLDSLALTQNFTLKAFLEHRTLTLEEHDRIFRLPRHESYQIFESLQNRQLIESVPTDEEGAPARSEIEEDLRYRVRPLLVGAVINHLRGRNIYH